MHCTEQVGALTRRLGVFMFAASVAMAASAQNQAPAKAPAAAPTKAPAAAPAKAPPKGKPAAATPAVPKTLEEFKKIAARKMLAANPDVTYSGKPQQMNFGIPILEIELNDDATVKNISVVRPPANEAAASTVDIAMEAIKKAAPYGDISRLPKPVKWTEVFLFNDQKKFKPRSLE